MNWALGGVLLGVAAGFALLFDDKAKRATFDARAAAAAGEKLTSAERALVRAGADAGTDFDADATEAS